MKLLKIPPRNLTNHTVVKASEDVDYVAYLTDSTDCVVVKVAGVTTPTSKCVAGGVSHEDSVATGVVVTST